MKIYLAGKIAGDPKYREKFQKAQARLERDGVTVLNPAVLPAGLTKADYMRLSFAMIDAADEVTFLPDAEESPGAQLERRYCEYIGKPFSILNPPKEPEPPGEVRPWSGFVHIRCDHFHKESTVCLRTPTRRYECRECGNTMDLPNATVAYINCECGFNGRYITNVTDWFFDIPCAQCGRPNTVKFLPGSCTGEAAARMGSMCSTPRTSPCWTWTACWLHTRTGTISPPGRLCRAQQPSQGQRPSREGDPMAKNGVVGAFCRVYDIEAAMAAFLPGVYAPVDSMPGRFSFTGGSTTGGAVYTNDGEVATVHNCKIDAFMELVEQLNGEHALTFFWYKHEKDRILQALAGTGLRVRVYEGPGDERAWNAGEVDILLAHPVSCGYGLNLQAGGHHCIWYTLPNWALEIFQQANKRLHRQGQQFPVISHLLIVQDSVDTDVFTSMQCKGDSQEALMQALKARIIHAKKEEAA